MGAKTSAVGGGAATGTANDFNAFLRQQLSGGMMGGGGGMPNNMGVGYPSPGGSPLGATPRHQIPMGMPQGGPSLDANIAVADNAARQPYQQTQQAMQNLGGDVATFDGGMLNSTQQNPMQQNSLQYQQQQGGFQNQFQNMMNGNITGQDAINQWRNMMTGGQPGQAMNFNNPYQSQNYIAPQGIQQMGQNPLSGTGMADLSGVGGMGPDMMQGFGQNSDYLTSALRGLQNFNTQGVPQVNAAGTQFGEAKQFDLNDPNMKAMQAGVDRQKMIDTANLRARFGAQGAGALGTGAQVAEATLGAEYAPRQAAIMQNFLDTSRNQDLAERTASANVGMANANNAMQASIANAANKMQGYGLNQQALSTLMSGGLQNKGLDINQLGQASNAALTGRGQNINAALTNQGMGNQQGYNQAVLNQNATQQNNANAFNSAGMQNQFNLNNAGNMANYGLGTNQLNLNAQGQNYQQNLSQLGSMLQQSGMSQQGISQMMSQLFGGLGQSNALGTPQAQMVTTPNPWMQGLQAAAQIGGNMMAPGGGNALKTIMGLFTGGGGGNQSYNLPNGIGWQPSGNYMPQLYSGSTR